MAWQTFAHEADIGVRGCGATLAEAFAGAATALTATVCDPARVAAKKSVLIECEAPDEELLLVDWLNALVYEMATRGMLFSRFKLGIEGCPTIDRLPVNSKPCRLHGTAWGEPVDIARHQPAAEVKGVSFCELAVRQMADGQWHAQCIVDV